MKVEELEKVVREMSQKIGKLEDKVKELESRESELKTIKEVSKTAKDPKKINIKKDSDDLPQKKSELKKNKYYVIKFGAETRKTISDTIKAQEKEKLIN